MVSEAITERKSSNYFEYLLQSYLTLPEDSTELLSAETKLVQLCKSNCPNPESVHSLLELCTLIKEKTESDNKRLDQQENRSEEILETIYICYDETNIRIDELVKETKTTSARVDELAKETKTISAKIDELAKSSNAQIEGLAKETKTVSAKIDELAKSTNAQIEGLRKSTQTMVESLFKFLISNEKQELRFTTIETGIKKILECVEK